MTMERVAESTHEETCCVTNPCATRTISIHTLRQLLGITGAYGFVLNAVMLTLNQNHSSVKSCELTWLTMLISTRVEHGSSYATAALTIFV